MKIYATFKNPNSGLVEKQLIDTKNYTRDELNTIALYDILFNNWETASDTVELSDYEIKISSYLNDSAKKFMNILSKNELDEIIDVIKPSLIEYHTLFH
jgi:hypothetical protein